MNLINSVKSFDENNFTKTSWSNMLVDLNAAKEILNNTNSSQQQVDQAFKQLESGIKRLQKKQIEPTVMLENIKPNIDQKSITINYKIVDPDKTLQSIKVNVYNNGNLEAQKDVNLNNYSVIVNNLRYHTEYTFKTDYTYIIENRTITKKQIENVRIELSPKKLEFNNFNSVKLYKINNDGKLNNILGLQSIPTDLSNYAVRVNSINNKDILLPISNIEEVNDNNISRYKVTVSYPELITYDPLTNDYTNNYSFYINKIINKENTYTTFNELISAINQNPSGTFIIGSDLSASEVTNNNDSYVTETFSGTLTSEKGHSYSIYNLSKPLFNTINGGNVKNINLVDVNISGGKSNVGSIAKDVQHTVIDNVHVEGIIKAPTNIGGLVYSMKNSSTIMNSSFEGSINITSTDRYFAGGLVGLLTENSTINRSYANIKMVLSAYGTNDSQNRAGGLVGQSQNTTLVSNSYVKGNIINNGNAGFIGGIVGSAWWNGKFNNVLTYVNVINGNIVHGDLGYTNAPFTNIYSVTGIAKGSSYPNVQEISSNEANELIKQWGISTISLVSSPVTTDYSQLSGYQKDREIAYHNVEKLIPLYDRYTVLKYGNLVDPSMKLYNTLILSVTPMSNNNIIADIFNNLMDIDQILVHYIDGTVEKYHLSNPTNFKNTKLVEFKLANNLIYTPMQFKTDFSTVIDSVLNNFNGINFLSEEMLNKFGFMWTDKELKILQDNAVNSYKQNHSNETLTSEKEQLLRNQAKMNLQTDRLNKLRDMYLLESFDQVKNNLGTILRSILTNNVVVDLDSQSITKYLIEKLNMNALNLLLGISYINRLYNINYGDINIKNIALYLPNFYGKKVDNLDWLISFGNIGYEGLKVKNNYNTYSTQFSEFTGKISLIDYLDYNRHLFVPNMSENEWFKSATKAYIYEAKSKEVPNVDVRIYPRLKGKNRSEYRNFILPLLNLTSNNVFIVTNMSTITFGLYERYIDEALKKTPDVYAEKIKEFESTIQHYGDLWADYYDTWYRIVDDKVKSRLYTIDIPIWDGYWIIDKTQSGYYKNRWVGQYDTSVPAMIEFFGAVGKWYAPNGVGAYANGSLVHFVVDAVVSDYGSSVLTHEMTHNFDGRIYLNGYGRRTGQGAENFADGLLQSPSNKNAASYGLNLIFNWDKNSLRSQNYSPIIFQNDLDLYKYMHGVFDVTYLLDYLEAEVSLSKTKDDQKLLYRKLTFENGSDKVIQFTDNEWDKMNLKTVDDLIDNNVVSKRYYDNANVGNNSYFEISMYAPIYSALQNSNGASGGLVFRKTAFELLAAKGWNDGFVAYTSNKYATEAQQENKVFSDTYIINKIFGSEYSDYAAFKKEMFKERIDKKDSLKQITITWDRQNRVINTYDDLKTLFQDALNKDLELAKTNRNMHYIDDLKAQIMQAYHVLTHDFKDSIFK
ncbi:ZmpA/ZmpB/ZmpC family metallo-endopeptidase [Enterococcus hirae]|uniref:ZmpA/ZmpB/ZmpC family metallo-endopeptidase n=1 Tax=Enterococcus hirae TaxID=1354 RepID=UPI003981A62A